MVNELVKVIRKLESRFNDIIDEDSDMIYRISLGIASDALELNLEGVYRKAPVGIPVGENRTSVRMPKSGTLFENYHCLDSGILIPRCLAEDIPLNHVPYHPPEKIYLIPLQEERNEPEPREELSRYF